MPRTYDAKDFPTYKRRVRRRKPTYKAPIGPPAPGHRRPGPYPQSSQPTYTGFKKGEHRKVRRFKKTRKFKRAYKAAQRSRTRYERRKAQQLAVAHVLEQARREHESPLGVKRGGFDFSGVLGDAAKRGGSVALDVLEETTRPVHGLAGAARSAVKGGGWKDQQKAFVRGIENKDKYLFSDVLKELGAPKWLSTTGGFALDVFADPTTYVTFGVGAPAKKLALEEGRRIFEKATAKGMSEEGARTVANRATARKMAELQAKGEANKGLTVGFAGKKTSGKTTAKLSRKTGVSNTAKAIRGDRRVQGVGENLRPDFRPSGVGEESFKGLRVAERRHRAASHLGERRAQQKAVAYSKAISRKEHAEIIDALEAQRPWSLAGRKVTAEDRKAVANALRAGKGDLDDGLRKVAVALRMRGDLRHLHRLERRAGVAGKGRIENYFPHIPAHTMEPGAKPLPGARVPQVRAATNLSSARARKIKETLATLREKDPSLFSEDAPLVFGTRAAESARGVAKANFLSSVAKLGRRMKVSHETGEVLTPIDTGAEWAYKVTPKKIVPVDSLEDAAARTLRGERIVVLNRSVAERALKNTARKTGKLAKAGRVWDRSLQGRVKTILTVPNPQYHFTNLYGDLFNAYLAGTSPNSLRQSFRAQVRIARREAAIKTLGKQMDPLDKGVKINGKKVTYDELIEEAEREGSIRTGFIGRDLPDVMEAQSKEMAEQVGKGRLTRKLGEKGQRVVGSPRGETPNRIVPKLLHPIDTIRNVSQYREDFVRLATHIQARKMGLSAAEAAERVAKFHFDYGDLTELEQSLLRRVFPFYTFTARNTPLQGEMLLTRPGKYANLQKVREEFTKLAGLPDGWEDKLEDYEQRGIPLPLPIKDSLGHNLMLFPKLPATDLGRFTLDPTEQFRYGMAMLSPIIKAPTELLADYNFFFGEKITNAESPLVPAPDGVGLFPKDVRDKLGIARIRDVHSRKKKMIWGWPAKVDYVARLTPLSATGLQMATDAKNQRGQSSEMKLFGFLTGLKLTPYDPTKNALNAAYDEREKIAAQKSLLLQQERTKYKSGAYRPEYRKLLDKEQRLGRLIYRLKKKAGDKLPSTGEPLSLDERIEKRISGGTDVDDLIEKRLGGQADVDALIEKRLGN